MKFALIHEAKNAFFALIHELHVIYLYRVLKKSALQFVRKKTPPPGGFLFTMFPDQEPGGRGPPSKN